MILLSRPIGGSRATFPNAINQITSLHAIHPYLPMSYSIYGLEKPFLVG